MIFSVTNCPYTLGNRVWVESDNDGIFEMASGDFPLDGVKVNLYLDNGNGELDASDGAAIATQWTHSGGYYLFKNLNRGNYIVQVDPVNFNAGGILANFSTTTGNDPAPDPDNNIDNDDNGKTVSGFGVASSAITLEVRNQISTKMVC
ncbi:MAG: hypothetical protein IPI53_11270 [Saprospiraceae bacterium]|nr:hypothetical protein [Saprospiraceae bacterium]